MSTEVLLQFDFPDGSTWQGPGRLIARDGLRGKEVALQYEGVEPGTWEDLVSENATEAAALVHGATLAACAELVQAAGCLCAQLRYAWAEDQTTEFRWAGRFERETAFRDTGAVLKHDPRCPAAILAVIEARGSR